MHAVLRWRADADCCLYVGRVAALSQCYRGKPYRRGRWFCFKTLTQALTFAPKYCPTRRRAQPAQQRGCRVSVASTQDPHDDLGTKGLPGWALLLLPGRQPQPALGGLFAAFRSWQRSVFPSWGSSGLNHHLLPPEPGLGKSCI